MKQAPIYYRVSIPAEKPSSNCSKWNKQQQTPNEGHDMNRIVVLVLMVLCSVGSVAAQTITLVSGNGGAIGTPDPLTLCSTNSGASFYSAFITPIVANRGTIQGAQWTGVQSDGQGLSDFTFVYRTSFTIPAGYGSPSLTIQLLADDYGTVFLNGNEIGSQPYPNPPHDNWTNPAAIFSTSDPSLFSSGQNIIQINCYNHQDQAFNATGIDFKAVIVPEPTTWSLLALGFVTLLGGCQMRRRS